MRGALEKNLKSPPGGHVTLYNIHKQVKWLEWIRVPLTKWWWTSYQSIYRNDKEKSPGPHTRDAHGPCFQMQMAQGQNGRQLPAWVLNCRWQRLVVFVWVSSVNIASKRGRRLSQLNNARMRRRITWCHALTDIPSKALAASTRWDQFKPVAVSGRGIRPGSLNFDLSARDPSENQNSSEDTQTHTQRWSTCHRQSNSFITSFSWFLFETAQTWNQRCWWLIEMEMCDGLPSDSDHLSAGQEGHRNEDGGSDHGEKGQVVEWVTCCYDKA